MAMSPSFGGDACGGCEHGFRRAFDREQKSIAAAVHGRHHLAGGIEGVLARDRVALDAARGAFDAGSAAGAQQRELHRIAARSLGGVAERGVVAEHGDFQQADKLRIVGKLQPDGGMDLPAPSSSISPEGIQNRRTVIRFSVRVPVLSVRMTVVAPSVSTADSRSISAFCRAMRHMPRASAKVATIGRPSGIAATASAIAASTMRKASLPVARPIAGDQRGQDQGGPDELAGKARKLLLQRRASRFGLLDQLGDSPKLGLQAGRHDYANAAAACDGGALEQHRACDRPGARRRRRAPSPCRPLRIRRSASIRRRRGWMLRSASGPPRPHRRPPTRTMSPGTSLVRPGIRRVWPSRRTRAERVPSAAQAPR